MKILFILLFLVSCQRDVKTIAVNYALQNDIKPAVMLRWIKRESRFNSKAYNKKENAFGLLQVRCHLHKKRCNIKRCEDLCNPHVNLKCAFKVLNEMCKSRGLNEVDAFRCYNAGFNGAVYKKRGYGYAEEITKG